MSAAPVTTVLPEPSEIDVLDASMRQDMPAATRRLREHHPLAHAPLLGAWFVLRHADVLRLLGDERLASGYAALGEGPSGRVSSGTHTGPLLTPTGDTLSATGKKSTIVGSSTYQIINGKVVKGWTYWDMVSLLSQLGIMPVLQPEKMPGI